MLWVLPGQRGHSWSKEQGRPASSAEHLRLCVLESQIPGTLFGCLSSAPCFGACLGGALLAGGLSDRERLGEGLLPLPPLRFLLFRRRLPSVCLFLLLLLVLLLLLLLLLLRLLSLLLLPPLPLLWSGKLPDAALIHRVGIRPMHVIHEGWAENFKMNVSAARNRADGARAFKSLTKYFSQHRRSSTKVASKPSAIMVSSRRTGPALPT